MKKRGKREEEKNQSSSFKKTTILIKLSNHPAESKRNKKIIKQTQKQIFPRDSYQKTKKRTSSSSSSVIFHFYHLFPTPQLDLLTQIFLLIAYFRFLNPPFTHLAS